MAAVVLVLGGGFAAWKFLGHHATHPNAATTPPVRTSQAGPGAGQVAASTPTPAATASAAAPPTPTPSPASSGPGGTFPVAASSAVTTQPGEPQVVSFLQHYFTAINGHNYAQYAALLAPSQRPSPGQFQSGYGSTTDSAATLTSITATGNGVAATVKFTSHQSPSASPTGTGCNAWHITLFLESGAGGYRIGPAVPGYHARYRAC